MSLLRRTRSAALFALLLIVGTVPASMSAVMHDTGDDALCDGSLVVHDEAAHRFTAPRPAAPEPQHCAICHWLQSLNVVSTSARLAAPSTVRHRLAVGSQLRAGSIVGGSLAARAPPLA